MCRNLDPDFMNISWSSNGNTNLIHQVADVNIVYKDINCLIFISKYHLVKNVSLIADAESIIYRSH